MWQAKQLSLVMQLISMRQRYPSFRARVKRGQLVAIGDLVPSKQSRTYRIKLLYALRDSPRVYVIAPDLSHLPGGDSLPHVYSDNQLCLYLPGSGEWTQSMFLADTIIPWASEWLLWYELWRATGEWHGGGIHPDPNNSTLPPSVRRSLKKGKRHGLQNISH